MTEDHFVVIILVQDQPHLEIVQHLVVQVADLAVEEVDSVIEDPEEVAVAVEEVAVALVIEAHQEDHLVEVHHSLEREQYLNNLETDFKFFCVK